MKSYEIAAFAGPAIAFLGITIAIFLNSGWWSITDNAISDMGRIGVKYCYVLDISLILAGIVSLYSTFFVFQHLHGSVEKWSMYFFMVAMFFLTMIGIFPEGTEIHWKVSALFFLIGTFSMFFAGIGAITNGESWGFLMAGITIGAFILSITTAMIFRGVAIPELLDATGITSSYYILVYQRVIKQEISKF